jgi:hypothetical protein
MTVLETSQFSAASHIPIVASALAVGAVYDRALFHKIDIPVLEEKRAYFDAK